MEKRTTRVMEVPPFLPGKAGKEYERRQEVADKVVDLIAQEGMTSYRDAKNVLLIASGMLKDRCCMKDGQGG